MLATESDNPKTIAAGHSQPNARAAKCAESRRDEALQHRAGNGDAAHRQQFVEMELQADAEHQQDDADFGELLGKVDVRGVSRSVGTDDDAGHAGSRRSATGQAAE